MIIEGAAVRQRALEAHGDMTPLQSDVVGQYELLRLLGHGGFCAVYEARDRGTGEHVALKQLRRMGPASLSSFKREFRAVQGVHHTNLVELRELFEVGGASFIAMELVVGSDLVSHVRSGNTPLGFDEDTLRRAFGQLSQGLVALHAAGVVHRDLKPRNVLVTARGRVVLLDFGLVKTLGGEDEVNDRGVGSAAYMAPEQAAGAPLSPAADFYALGVCLYEALTGNTPFAAHLPFELMEIKQRQAPPPPSAIRPGVPQELDSLCMRLLELRPGERPTGLEVERAFDVEARESAPAHVRAASGEGFAGREREIEVLDEAFARSSAGELSLVLVEGESGIGKSTLVAEFLRRLQQQHPDALILRSRCYENELLAYKAFDSGMEQIARELALLDDATCQALLPAHAVLLPRLFAAFGAVRAIAEAKARAVPADPTAQRLAAFRALSSLLAALGRQRPLVLSIDDLHWADPESFRLLRAMREDAQPPSVLIVGTVRPRSERSEDAAAAISLLQSWSCTQVVSIDGLSRRAALELASELLGVQATEAMRDTLVQESRGHPLFLAELARYAGTRALSTGQITLDDALCARIDALAPAAERLMGAVALAGRPYHAEVFAAAMELELSDFRSLSTELLARKLLRRGRGQELACFHDRIGRVARNRLDRERARALHERLAAALAQQPTSDPAELASHYDAAGHAVAAIEAYGRAGQQALSALAFARAEQLFLRALTLAADTTVSPGTLGALQLGRAHALARGGFGTEAARQYLQAAHQAEGEAKTQLRIWAAQQLLQSARVEEGMRAARALLDELGVPLPSSTAATIARLVWDRTCIRLRGLEVKPAQGPMPVKARMQLDALWGLAMPVAWLDPLRSAALSTRHLRLARAFGEPTHMARALAEAAFTRTIQDPDDANADKLLARARALCEASDDPALEVYLSFREATVATFRWDLPRARERLEHAQQVGTEDCPDQPWLLTNVRTNLSSLFASMGEHARLAASCTAWLSEARDRNDQFAASMLEGLGYGSFRHLMADDPNQARASLDAVLSPLPREPFSFAHFGQLIGVSSTELYRGGDGARRWLEQELPRLSRAFLLKGGLGKGLLLMSRARASLAASTVASADMMARLLSEAHSYIRALNAIKLSFAAITARSLEAQLLALGGQNEAALIKAREVHTQATSRGYSLLLYPNAYLEGLLEGGETGRHKQQSALAFFADQGWQKPRRTVAMMYPVIDQLEARP